MDYDEVTRRYLLASMILGVASMFVYQLYLVPLAAIITGAFGVARNDPGRLTGKWRGWLGIVLGTVYLFAALVWSLAR
jgi:hypothetical protein